MKRTLAPIIHKDAYTRLVEGPVRDYFYETIFGPLIEILKDAGVPRVGLARDRHNAVSGALVEALRSGRVWYADGQFYGEFGAAIARELRSYGASFNERTKSFTIAAGNVPQEIRTVMVQSVERAKDVHERIDSFLVEAERNVVQAATGIETDVALSRIRGDMWRQFEQSVKGIDFIEVPAQITDAGAKLLAEDFNRNLDLGVKNFLAHEIPEMRELVEKNAYAGHRTDRLADIIQSRYGVSKRKAAFLADQESSLFVSKFREQRAKSIGSQTYRWSTSGDERVRADHRALDGTIQSWESKPVTNRKTGARNHPGEDFRCRCVALAMIEELGDTGAYTNEKEFRCTRQTVTVGKTP